MTIAQAFNEIAVAQGGTANAESPMHADTINIGDFSSEYAFVMPDADVVVFYSVNPE